jgi:hypothetical protein
MTEGVKGVMGRQYYGTKVEIEVEVEIILTLTLTSFIALP